MTATLHSNGQLRTEKGGVTEKETKKTNDDEAVLTAAAV